MIKRESVQWPYKANHVGAIINDDGFELWAGDKEEREWWEWWTEGDPTLQKLYRPSRRPSRHISSRVKIEVLVRDGPVCRHCGQRVAWGHKMGPLDRGCTSYGMEGAYVLRHGARSVAVATHSTLVRTRCGGGLPHISAGAVRCEMEGPWLTRQRSCLRALANCSRSKARRR